jgi:acyl-CoA thioester hydrolase
MPVTPYTRKVHFYETDRMGIVHHSNYARWFEEARLHYMEQVGLPYPVMEEWGVLSPVLYCNAVFHKPLRFPEEFSVDVKLKEFGGIRFSVAYQIYVAGHEQPVTTGETGHCFLNASMHPVRLDKQYPELHARMLALLESE